MCSLCVLSLQVAHARQAPCSCHCHLIKTMAFDQFLCLFFVLFMQVASARQAPCSSLCHQIQPK
jgi:hypothetical protein